MKAATLLLAGMLAACAGESQAMTVDELVYEVDVERVRALGWAAADATDADALAAAAAMLARRLPLDEDTTLALAEASSEIRLDLGRQRPGVQVERISNAVESLGSVEFRILPEADQLAPLGTDLDAERAKLRLWREDHPAGRLATFNALPAADGGPHARLVWLQFRTPAEELVPAPVLVPTAFEDTFGAASFERVGFGQDSSGFPAVHFELRDELRAAFGDFTAANADRQMALIAYDEILSALRIDERLPGGGIIRGRFTDAEVKALVAHLRTGHGPLRRVR